MRLAAPDRFFSPLAVRLALTQAAVLVAAFSVAGGLAIWAVRDAHLVFARTRVAAEARALHDSYEEDGLRNIREAIEHRMGRPGGSLYRLTAAGGARIMGDAATPILGAGAATRTVGRSLAVFYTLPLRGGISVTVGQTLAEADQIATRIMILILGCGAVGALAGIGLSLLLNLSLVRRIDGIAEVARSVSKGSLVVRASRRTGERRRDAIDEMADAFNAMLDEIERLIASVRQVSVAVAHDLRTPLTRVRQRLSAMSCATQDPALSAQLEAADNDLSGLLRIFQAMLRLADLEAHGRAVAKISLNIEEVVARVCDAYQPDIESGERRLQLCLGRGLLTGDPDLIGQVVANLLENAIRHTPPGTTITVETGSSETQTWLLVRDDGPGVPAGSEALILKPFHRLDPSRSRQSSGLGLALVEAISRVHGATLTIRNSHPGLEVALRFARHISDAPSASVKPEAQRVSSYGASVIQQAAILQGIT